jgi:hypothetical protein
MNTQWALCDTPDGANFCNIKAIYDTDSTCQVVAAFRNGPNKTAFKCVELTK